MPGSISSRRALEAGLDPGRRPAPRGGRTRRAARRRSAAARCIVAGSPWLCMSTTGRPLAPATREAVRVVAQRRDVVDHPGAGGDRRAHHRRLAGIDRDQDAAPGERLDHRHHARGSPRRPATGAAPGRVDSPPTSTMSAPSACSLSPVAIAAAGLEEAPAVGEAVGGDVDHAHDQRAALGQARGPRGRRGQTLAPAPARARISRGLPASQAASSPTARTSRRVAPRRRAAPDLTAVNAPRPPPSGSAQPPATRVASGIAREHAERPQIDLAATIRGPRAS